MIVSSGTLAAPALTRGYAGEKGLTIPCQRPPANNLRSCSSSDDQIADTDLMSDWGLSTRAIAAQKTVVKDSQVIPEVSPEPELVSRLRAKGHTQSSIAKTLGTSIGTVNADLKFSSENEDHGADHASSAPADGIPNTRGQQRPAFRASDRKADPANETHRLLAVDPGNRESAYVVVDVATCRPLRFAKIANDSMLAVLEDEAADVTGVVIEQIGHYGTGMPAGRDVFDTCTWIGRFQQLLIMQGQAPDLIERRHVKLHLCGSAKAKDSNVTQALVDRFAPGEPNHGKGTKSKPGWFYGFAADVWQAYALAVYAADTAALAV